MAVIDCAKSFKTDKGVTPDKINAQIKRQLGKTCKCRVSSDVGGTMALNGKVREAVFTPVTKFTATVSTTVEDERAEIEVSGKTGFTLLFYLLCCFIITIPVLVFLYTIQQHKPQRVIDEALASVAEEFRAR